MLVSVSDVALGDVNWCRARRNHNSSCNMLDVAQIALRIAIHNLCLRRPDTPRKVEHEAVLLDRIAFVTTLKNHVH